MAGTFNALNEFAAVTRANIRYVFNHSCNKKLSYCWETVRRESMPRIAEMDLEMTI